LTPLLCVSDPYILTNPLNRAHTPLLLFYICPQPLAQALAAMLKRAEPPICVGLYARWGSGKTFMISLLKREFDEDVLQDPHTKQLLQFFEKGYDELEPKQAFAEEPETVGSLINGLLLTILQSIVPYGVTTFASIICDAFNVRGALCAVWAWCSRLKRSCISCRPLAKTSPNETQGFQQIAQSEFKDDYAESANAKEYVFVDFNAWECATSLSLF